MRLGTIRSVQINTSIGMVVLMLVAVVVYGIAVTTVIFIALSLHELAHAITANRLGCRVSSIELQPFGFVAKLAVQPSSAPDALAIAAAGPVTSLVAASVAFAVCGKLFAPSYLLLRFAEFNLSIALLNLIPVLPLDGGRIALAAISRRRGEARAVRTLSMLGSVFACLLIGISIALAAIGSININPLIIGVFLLAASINERRRAAFADIRTRLRQSARLKSGHAMNVHMLAVNQSCSIGNAYSCLHSGGYNLILVLDDSMRRIGCLGECELLEAVSRLGIDSPISAIPKTLLSGIPANTLLQQYESPNHLPR